MKHARHKFEGCHHQIRKLRHTSQAIARQGSKCRINPAFEQIIGSLESVEDAASWAKMNFQSGGDPSISVTEMRGATAGGMSGDPEDHQPNVEGSDRDFIHASVAAPSHGGFLDYFSLMEHINCNTNHTSRLETMREFEGHGKLGFRTAGEATNWHSFQKPTSSLL